MASESVTEETNTLIRDLNNVRRLRDILIEEVNRREVEILSRLATLRDIPLSGVNLVENT